MSAHRGGHGFHFPESCMAMAISETVARRPNFLARKSTRKAVLIWSFLAPSLLIFLLYRILPLGWNVLLSFEAWSPLKPAVFIGLDNYQEMFSDDAVFWQAPRHYIV